MKMDPAFRFSEKKTVRNHVNSTIGHLTVVNRSPLCKYDMLQVHGQKSALLSCGALHSYLHPALQVNKQYLPSNT